MNELKIETEILKKTEALNLEIYALFCKLDRYKDKLTEPAYKFMAAQLYTLYREEFDRIFAPYEIARAQEKYAHKKRRAKFVPREGWLFRRKNRAAKHFFERIKIEAEKFFEVKPGEIPENRDEGRAIETRFARKNPEKKGLRQNRKKGDI